MAELHSDWELDTEVSRQVPVARPMTLPFEHLSPVSLFPLLFRRSREPLVELQLHGFREASLRDVLFTSSIRAIPNTETCSRALNRYH